MLLNAKHLFALRTFASPPLINLTMYYAYLSDWQEDSLLFPFIPDAQATGFSGAFL